MNLLLYLVVILSLFTSINCARILGIFPSPGYSQFIMCEKLMTELAHRGHEVTVIAAYKPKEEVKNYRTILTNGMVGGSRANPFLLQDNSIFTGIFMMNMMGNVLTEYVLSHDEVQNLIHSNETFDLVILERFLNEAHFAFSKHFNAPLILFSSVAISEWTSQMIGNPRLISVEPALFSPYTNHMKFLQRVHNSVLHMFSLLCKHIFVYPRHQNFVNKYFPNKINLKEVMYNASLLLLSSHPTTAHPSALTSSIVEIGGFHISPKKLPEDIQTFLDEAKEGAIFFSMGSNVNTADIPKDLLSTILKVFSKIKQRVLWKFSDSSLPNRPKNLLISKWLPQSDILAHPNTVAFITHAGFGSVTEATHYGVPMLAIPLFGDQRMNTARIVQQGRAIHLNLKNFTEETFHHALTEILKNPKYQQNAKEASAMLNDRVVKPLDLAMYWIEYVIRYPRMKTYFRNSSLDLYWFQLYLVDLAIFIAFSVVIFYYLVKVLIRILRVILRKSPSKNDSSTNKTDKKKKRN